LSHIRIRAVSLGRNGRSTWCPAETLRRRAPPFVRLGTDRRRGWAARL